MSLERTREATQTLIDKLEPIIPWKLNPYEYLSDKYIYDSMTKIDISMMCRVLVFPDNYVFSSWIHSSNDQGRTDRYFPHNIVDQLVSHITSVIRNDYKYKSFQKDLMLDEIIEKTQEQYSLLLKVFADGVEPSTSDLTIPDSSAGKLRFLSKLQDKCNYILTTSLEYQPDSEVVKSLEEDFAIISYDYKERLIVFFTTYVIFYIIKPISGCTRVRSFYPITYVRGLYFFKRP